MTKLFFNLLLLLVITAANAQSVPDSVFIKYRNSKTDKEKIFVINRYFNSISKDSSLFLKSRNELFNYFTKKDDELGLNILKARTAYRYHHFIGDYPAALNGYYDVLNYVKKQNDTPAILNIYSQIASVYDATNNYLDGIATEKKMLQYTVNDTGFYSLSDRYNRIGTIYAQALMPDSGIFYAQKGVAIDEKYKDTIHLCYTLSALAENYIAKGDYDIALPILRKSLLYSERTTLSKQDRSFIYNDFAKIFLGKKQYDSALHYAYLSLAIAEKINYKQQQLRTYEYLYTAFDQIGKPDSANKYYRLAINLKDSTYNTEKQKAIESAKFKAQLQQQEIQQKEEQVQQERKENIQYALMAIGIIILLSLYLLLSRSFIANVKLIEFFGVVALLIVFEFLNLLLHPFLEKITHHNLLFMLLTLVCIAALLVPLHHKIEKWALAKLVEKNKKIRLVKAKKTIEELENKET